MWIVNEVGNVNSASMNDGLEYEDDNVNVENGRKMALWMTLTMTTMAMWMTLAMRTMALWMTLAMKQRESSSAPAARPFERSVPLNLE